MNTLILYQSLNMMQQMKLEAFLCVCICSLESVSDTAALPLTRGMKTSCFAYVCT